MSMVFLKGKIKTTSQTLSIFIIRIETEDLINEGYISRWTLGIG